MTDARFEPNVPEFVITLGGYDRDQVDAVVRVVHDALVSEDPARRSEATEVLRGAAFSRRLRGYSASMVDDYLNRLTAALAVP